MSDSDEALATLQLHWFRALHEGTDVDDVLARLHSAPLTPAHRAWIDTFDRRALEVALSIAKRWIRTEASDL